MRAATLYLSLSVFSAGLAAFGPGLAPAAAQAPEQNSTNLGAFDERMIGRIVYGPDGQPVGEVRALDRGRLIVAVDSALGIGTREIGLTRAQVGQSGSGLQPRLVTSLTRQELSRLPEAGGENAPLTGPPRGTPRP